MGPLAGQEMKPHPAPRRIGGGSPLDRLVPAARWSWAAVLLLFTLSGCDSSGTTEPEAGSRLSQVARAYLEQALDIMEAHSINRYKIEWVGFRASVLEYAGSAETTADTYPAIRFALDGLGDGHSFFLAPSGALQSPESSVAATASPSSKLLDGRVGYLTVPAFSGSGASADLLANSYHRLVEAVDTLGVCAWVVDARSNQGGNMWPMLAGIGPILGEGTAGYFVDPDSVWSVWAVEGGAATLNGVTVSSSSYPYTPEDGDRPVALLVDSFTASSGEAVAVAFQGRPATRTFGLPTRGLSTANRGFSLSDGALLVLTVSTMADRLRRIYGGALQPDQLVDGIITGFPGSDAALGAALDWLDTQPECSVTPPA